jgi:S1-C subfamily serine protease
MGDTLAFPGDHPIATARGQVPIKDVRPSDRLLGADGRFRPHDGVMEIHGPTHILSGDGHPAIEVHSDHEVVVRHRDKRSLGEPELVPAGGLRPPLWGDRGPTWATPTRIEPLPVPPLPVSTPELWWVAGRYLTSGRLRSSRRGGPKDVVEFTAQEPEFEGLRGVLRPGRRRRGEPLVWQEVRRGTESVFRVHHPGLAAFFREHVGDARRERGVPMWLLGAPRRQREAFFGGALSPHWHGGHLSRPAHQRPDVPSPNQAAAVGLRMLGSTLDHRIDLATKGLLGRWHLSWLREEQGHHSAHRLSFKKRPPQAGRALWHRIGAVRRGAQHRKLYAVRPQGGTLVVGGMLFGSEGAPTTDPKPRQRPEPAPSGGGGGGGRGRRPSPERQPIAPIIPLPTGRRRREREKPEPERQPTPTGELPADVKPGGTAREVLDRILAAPGEPVGAAERVPLEPREPVLAQRAAVPAAAERAADAVRIPVGAGVPQEVPAAVARTAAQAEALAELPAPAMHEEAYIPAWARLPEAAREAAVHHLQGHAADAVVSEPVRAAVEAFRDLPPTDQYAVLSAADRAGASEAARVPVGPAREETTVSAEAIPAAVEQPMLPGVEVPLLQAAPVDEPRTISELLDVARSSASQRESAVVRGEAAPTVTDRAEVPASRRTTTPEVGAIPASAVRVEAEVPGVPASERSVPHEGDGRDVPAARAQGDARVEQPAPGVIDEWPVAHEAYADAAPIPEPARQRSEKPVAPVETRYADSVAYPAHVRAVAEPDIVWNHYEVLAEQHVPVGPQVFVDGVPARAELVPAGAVPVAIEAPPEVLRLPAPQEAFSPVFFGASDLRTVPAARGDWEAVVRRVQNAGAVRELGWRERFEREHHREPTLGEIERKVIEDWRHGVQPTTGTRQPGHGGWERLPVTRVEDAVPPRARLTDEVVRRAEHEPGQSVDRGGPAGGRPDLPAIELRPHAVEPSGLSSGMQDAHAVGHSGRSADAPPADRSGRGARRVQADERVQEEVARNLAQQRESQRASGRSSWAPGNLTGREAGLYLLAQGALHERARVYSEALRYHLSTLPEEERAAQTPQFVDALRGRLQEEWDRDVGNVTALGTRGARDYPMPQIPADYLAGLDKPLQHPADRALERTAADIQRDTTEQRQGFARWADEFLAENGREPTWAEVDRHLGLDHERELFGPVLTGITAATIAFTNAGGAPVHHHESRPLDTVAIADRVDQGLVSIFGDVGGADHVPEGTGIVLTPDGKILTADHVIHGDDVQRVDGAIQVVDATGQTHPAVVLAENTRDDVALLQALGMDNPMVPAELRDSDTVQRGEPIETIGDVPRGDVGQHTVHAGHVTELHDDVAVDDGAGSTRTVPDEIESDAQAVPGDSGGPVTDAEGRVVAVTESGTNEFPYVAAATPIDRALRDLWEVRPSGDEPRIEEPTVPQLDAAQDGVAPPVEVDADGRVVERGVRHGDEVSARREAAERQAEEAKKAEEVQRAAEKRAAEERKAAEERAEAEREAEREAAERAAKDREAIEERQMADDRSLEASMSAAQKSVDRDREKEVEPEVRGFWEEVDELAKGRQADISRFEHEEPEGRDESVHEFAEVDDHDELDR